MKRRLMKAATRSATLVMLVMLAMVAMGLGAAAVGAQPQKGTSDRVGAGFVVGGRCSVKDKVMVTNLTINPAQPTAGQQVTVSLTIKNNCDVAVTVPWLITGGTSSVVVGSGSQPSVPAGSSFTVSGVWTATAGQSGVYATADPKNVLAESAADRVNNAKTYPVTVGTISASTQGAPLPKVRQLLNYAKAKEAGATFNHNIPMGTATCSVVGQFDPIAGGYVGQATSSVYFQIACLGPTTVEPEAFMNFKLKNNWRIVAVNTKVEPDVSYGEWQWVNRPNESADTPGMKMRISVGAGGKLLVSVGIMIEGPESTCPYTATAGACP